MTPWEESVLSLLLRTTTIKTRLPRERLELELTAEPKSVRQFWESRPLRQPNRLVLLHWLIELMREREAPDFFVRAWWPILIDYIDPVWELIHPRTGKRTKVRAAFCSFKRQYDLDTNIH